MGQHRFPNPQDFINKMLDRKVRINLWTNPYVSPDSKIYKEMYPVSGSHTVWCGIVPDFGTKKAQELLKTKFSTEHLNLGVSGYKIDEMTVMTIICGLMSQHSLPALMQNK